MPSSEQILRVRGLHTQFATRAGTVKAVDGIDLDLHRGEILGLVGESGSGKTVTALSIMGLVRPPGEVTAGEIVFDKMSLRDLSKRELAALRGRRISMIFQQPRSSLNPVMKIGTHLVETLRTHLPISRAAARREAVDLLEMVGIPDPELRAGHYPHQLSGGQAQRVMIAIAMALRPELLIADEPTTALDVTVQAQILELIEQLAREIGTAVILVTHDLGVVAERADRVAVVYAGKLSETAPVGELFAQPRHPYTAGLLRSVPVVGRRVTRLAAIAGTVPDLTALPAGCSFRPRCATHQANPDPRCSSDDPAVVEIGSTQVRCWLTDGLVATAPVPEPQPRACEPDAASTEAPLVEVENLTVRHRLSGGRAGAAAVVTAVDDVSFSIGAGETLGVVGESGCGKTSVGMAMLKLYAAESGAVRVDGVDLLSLDRSELRRARRNVQIVFQDPLTSLDPRATVGASIRAGLDIQRLGTSRERAEKVEAVLERVGLDPSHADRYPHEFSGGQRQRIGIARALVLQPKVIIADEAVSALDVSIQAQVLNLLGDIQAEDGTSLLFIAHNLAVVEHLSHRVAVMYLGRIVEIGPRDEVFTHPKHPYTQALLASVPSLDPDAPAPKTIAGDVPSALDRPSGCSFHPRCALAMPICAQHTPVLEGSGSHRAACWALPGASATTAVEVSAVQSRTRP